MCGIASIYHTIKPIDQSILNTLAQSMQRRGPDGQKSWIAPDARNAQIHARLAIIDLNERATQPMEHPSTDWILIFNGEIYNYQTLRDDLSAKGARFYTQSDTEVILVGIELYGRAFIKKLRGMFAFTLFNKKDGRIIAARDPFGIKPLYYSLTSEGVFFSSSVKTQCIALNHFGITTTKSAIAAALFLQWGSIPEPYTSFDEIHSVPTGSVIEINSQGDMQCEYFLDINEALVNAPKADITQLDFKKYIAESIRYHMVADVEVGVFLSAGLDSATIAALANEQHPEQIHGLTLGFAEYKGSSNDEVPLAKKIAANLGIKHSVRYVSEDDFDAIIDDFFEVMDQPTIDGLNTYLISQAAADAGLKCVLSGLGGDELLGGYPFSRNLKKMRALAPIIRLGSPILDTLAKRDKVRYKVQALGHAHTSLDFYKAQRGIFTSMEFSRFLPQKTANTLTDALHQAKSDHFDYDALNTFSASALLETTYFMRNQLLRDADWASMAHSLELRVPLVDSFLWQQCAAGWGEMKTTPQKDWLPKCYIGDWPSEFINRPKTGFITPVNQWLKKRNDIQHWRHFPHLENDKHHWSKRWCAEIFYRHFADVI